MGDELLRQLREDRGNVFEAAHAGRHHNLAGGQNLAVREAHPITVRGSIQRGDLPAFELGREPPLECQPIGYERAERSRKAYVGIRKTRLPTIMLEGKGV